jgi:hypothetical protein
MASNQQHPQTGNAERKIQNLANIATVISTVVAVLSDQWAWLLPAIIVAAFMFFAWKHGRVAAGFVSLVVVTAAAFVGLSRFTNIGTPGVPSPQSTTTSQSSTPNTVTTQPAEEEHTPTTIFDGEVIIKRHESVDVDRSPATIARNQDGAVGDGDLYLNPLAMPGALYAYGSANVNLVSLGTNNPSAAYDACTTTHNASPYGFVSLGSAICFTTSQGRMAWAAIGAVEQPIFSEPAASITLRVIVWDE